MPRETFKAKSDYVTGRCPAAGRAAMIAAAEAPAPATSCVTPTAARSAAWRRRDRVRTPWTALLHPVLSGVAATDWIEQAWNKLRPFVSGKAYQNYIDPQLNGWQHAYYGPIWLASRRPGRGSTPTTTSTSRRRSAASS